MAPHRKSATVAGRRATTHRAMRTTADRTPNFRAVYMAMRCSLTLVQGSDWQAECKARLVRPYPRVVQVWRLLVHWQAYLLKRARKQALVRPLQGPASRVVDRRRCRQPMTFAARWQSAAENALPVEFFARVSGRRAASMRRLSARREPQVSPNSCRTPPVGTASLTRSSQSRRCGIRLLTYGDRCIRFFWRRGRRPFIGRPASHKSHVVGMFRPGKRGGSLARR